MQRPDWAKLGDGVTDSGLAFAQKVIDFIELLNVPAARHRANRSGSAL
ncbi:hypothetical protein SAMCFNEI73_pB0118 (plasmid) [Sinorhizobium americanum]|uniref:Uncharacterized protein n=1 Tax=Sinorhizobium americanum TaxID=194963 RepID=A0A1L3LTA4_9HYPH|nr:hypothetical protein SAMCFNEI73_pB0118 [Sinorhizobium americanum]